MEGYFSLHLTQYVGKEILERHLFQKPPQVARFVQAGVPTEVGEEGLVRMLGLNLGDCMTITGGISFSGSQEMLLSAASSVVDHILTRSTYTDVLN